MSFLGLFESGFFFREPVNQSQYIWDSKIIQQAATTSGVDLYWRIDLLNFL